jgi:hypothetical protein
MPHQYPRACEAAHSSEEIFYPGAAAFASSSLRKGRARGKRRPQPLGDRRDRNHQAACGINGFRQRISKAGSAVPGVGTNEFVYGEQANLLGDYGSTGTISRKSQGGIDLHRGAGPMVRIWLPPAASLLRTRLEPRDHRGPLRILFLRRRAGN